MGEAEQHQKARIRAVELENFLSFEHARVELGKLNVLVGPNASGKSNFVKALLFLSGLSEGHSTLQVAEELLEMEFPGLIHGLDIRRQVRLKVELEINGAISTYEVVIDGLGRIRRELMAEDGSTVLMEREDFKGVYLGINDQKRTFEVSDRRYPSFIEISERDAHPLLLETWRSIRNIRTYSFEPHKIRSEAESGFNLELRRDGSNLAQVLLTLLTYRRKKFMAVEDTLRSLVPEIEELNVPLTEKGDRTYIAISEENIEGLLGPSNISDGTLRLLAFITAIHLGGSLVAFEEPENCVHPYLLQSLVDLCRHGPSQVVITTHSPYLVDKLEPEELLLVVKQEGRSLIRRLTAGEKDRIKKMLEEGFTLGELWCSGELGGVP